MAIINAPLAIKLLATSLALNAAIQVQAALDKPLIQPEIPPLDGGLWANLAPTQSTHDQWEWGWSLLRCQDEAQRNGFSPYDMEVFNIHYTDCDSVWIMCRHHDSPMSQIQMIDIFGRMPVRMRQYVRHVIAFPSDSRHAYTWSDLGDVVLFGDAQNYPTLWVHEIGHSLDMNAISGYAHPFNTDNIWIDNYNLDSAISDSYAATNQGENFAQETVIALFDKVVPGGIGTVEPNWSAIYHQYMTAQGYLGDVLVPGGRCGTRFANDDVVCMGPAAGCASAKMARSMALPTIQVDPSVALIPVRDGAGNATSCSYFGGR
ncbi:hypothetical protein F4778DRAFT_505771 [Xylariomycetidae sp. FL2044]|nr:hypothetical protein F4778DRAFT_505771 [Xylariomycetidae sp. FL2044]